MSPGRPPQLSAVSVARASELARLRLEWGHSYIITAEYGAFAAQRRDTGAKVRASGPDALRRSIQDDHATRPVPEASRAPEAS